MKLLILFGNALDHYSTALYIFFAPYLVSNFFDFKNEVIALIVIYSLFSFCNIITRPAGAYFFGWLANIIDSRQVLLITLGGVGFSTCIVATIPSYESIGIVATILLTLAKILQGFCAAGEVSISSVLIFNTVKEKEFIKANSYYQCSTMIGIILASTVATIFNNWRYAFALGSLIGIIGLYFRLRIISLNNLYISDTKEMISFTRFNKFFLLLQVSCLHGLSYITYAVPFVLLDNIIPLISNISRVKMLTYSNILMYFDTAMIVVIGYIIKIHNYKIWMLLSVIILSVTMIPCFIYLPDLALPVIFLIKCWIIFWGVIFSTLLNVLLVQQVKDNKYLFIGTGYTIGCEFWGRSCVPICLALWKYFDNNLIAPAIYITVVCICTFSFLLYRITKI
ncbi:sugar (and other) transporter family protein [Orientia chuto str. Dubai]|uniref:Sugar (And other) transporter family protein n=1 Tax=Orientia chuto str. Dubai TaxID=1359168 RepID=A0A0F3MRK9_9RICK|nr:MFS transporter [Candidatus Orientia mediorientalis]KJV57234.1 sugar (and other) transporter family protein [Orientia chuto str. Dubai]